jgi:hypothetical protein
MACTKASQLGRCTPPRLSPLNVTSKLVLYQACRNFLANSDMLRQCLLFLLCSQAYGLVYVRNVATASAFVCVVYSNGSVSCSDMDLQNPKPQLSGVAVDTIAMPASTESPLLMALSGTTLYAVDVRTAKRVSRAWSHNQESVMSFSLDLDNSIDNSSSTGMACATYFGSTVLYCWELTIALQTGLFEIGSLVHTTPASLSLIQVIAPSTVYGSTASNSIEKVYKDNSTSIANNAAGLPLAATWVGDVFYCTFLNDNLNIEWVSPVQGIGYFSVPQLIRITFSISYARIYYVSLLNPGIVQWMDVNYPPTRTPPPPS